MDVLTEALSPEALGLAGGIIVKCIVGLILGGLIGIERDIRGHAAGVRTHMLLVLGAVLFGEVGRGFTEADHSRVAAGVVSGIGFLGGGAILRVGVSVKGLTTAATLWAAAAVGLAVSAGGSYLVVAVAATGLILLTLTLVYRLEHRLNLEAEHAQLVVRLDDPDAIPAILRRLEEVRAEVLAIRRGTEGWGDSLVLTVEERDAHTLALVGGLPGVRSAEWVP